MRDVCNRARKLVEKEMNKEISVELYFGSTNNHGFSHNGVVYINVAPICFEKNVDKDTFFYLLQTLAHQFAQVLHQRPEMNEGILFDMLREISFP